MSNEEKTASKGAKIGYYIGTALLTLLMTFSASMYLLNYDEMLGIFEGMNFPSWIIYPLAIAKILGLLALWLSKNKTIKQFAYAGFLFNLLLAIGAHLGAEQEISEAGGAIGGLLFWTLSFVFAKKINKA